ncbi:hypothetical protein [Sphingomicrobium sediminis]|uniref:Uncharacterized protein n=1 Tax=Sphingomicrobium sediminis TaxID=2950949 RepID=A0A9X2EH26_9SPHN|nr:hypothetical protein [Sphingomicrobium sediminis]MCM8556531.1 hypothetical protein [Sphingomicrobium sediminis]
MREYAGLIEIIFVAVIAFGFGGWQLWSVNREIKRDREEKARSDRVAGHAIGEHELDDR